jgi:hypothetical protein
MYLAPNSGRVAEVCLLTPLSVLLLCCRLLALLCMLKAKGSVVVAGRTVVLSITASRVWGRRRTAAARRATSPHHTPCPVMWRHARCRPPCLRRRAWCGQGLGWRRTGAAAPRRRYRCRCRCRCRRRRPRGARESRYVARVRRREASATGLLRLISSGIQPRLRTPSAMNLIGRAVGAPDACCLTGDVLTESDQVLHRSIKEQSLGCSSLSHLTER